VAVYAVLLAFCQIVYEAFAFQMLGMNNGDYQALNETTFIDFTLATKSSSVP
jgi:hypothetical protein